MDVPMKVPEPTTTISPAKFAHIVLYTKKFKEMVDWYCHFLGASLTGASHCLLYTSPSPRDVEESRMPSSA